ncbi:unnamed protein product [Linum tenue]|uniref:Patellin-3 n=1 Tax=Linum tenue TaxID=586396 RepID=A0AAV0RHE8_9ROSI|nr:unnamed protein product [Linum tenue]
MAEETQAPAATSTPAATTEEVVVVEKPVTESPAPVPEPEVEEKKAEEPKEKEEVVAVEEQPKEAEEAAAPAAAEEPELKIAQSVSFKEESNDVSELPEAQKKALEELKQLIQEALNKHEFTAPPPAPPAKEEEKKEEEAEKVVEIKEEAAEKTAEEAPITEEKKEEAPAVEATPAAEAPAAEAAPAAAVEEVKKEEEVEVKIEDKKEDVKEEATTTTVADVIAAPAVDEDGAKTVEAIEETIVAVASTDPPAAESAPDASSSTKPEETKTEEPKTEEEAAAPAAPPPPPEEVFIYGIPLLGDDRSDVILLKFLRARDFKVKDAFTMIKNTVRWRKEFGIDSLLEEDLGNELEKVVFTKGVDKEGHSVCYNVYGGFQDKELYQNCFGDDEKSKKFLRWRIQFLEKSIRNLDFSPTGICTIVQINDLKNSPGPLKRELRQATNQALTILQDNYPEFVARQVFINVPWWYLAFNKMISPFLTQRTKSKFVFAGPSKSAETLFKYIAPEQVPVQYGGLSKDGDHEFTTSDAVTEIVIKPAAKHTIELPATESCTLVWELRVLGWEVSYGAEFSPSVENGYTVIVSKNRKLGPTDEAVIYDSFKAGEAGKVVITIDNQSGKKKKLLYRTKTKPVSS